LACADQAQRLYDALKAPGAGPPDLKLSSGLHGEPEHPGISDPVVRLIGSRL
jgi:hypothetical protein